MCPIFYNLPFFSIVTVLCFLSFFLHEYASIFLLTSAQKEQAVSKVAIEKSLEIEAERQALKAKVKELQSSNKTLQVRLASLC